MRNPLFHLGLGILGGKNLGQGAAEGVDNYQRFLNNDVNYRAAEASFADAQQTRERLAFLSSPEGRQQMEAVGVPGFLAQYAPGAALGVAGDLTVEKWKREHPEAERRYAETDYGVLDTFTGEMKPYGPTGDGGFMQHPALKRHNPDNYTPASWVAANRTGDPVQLRRNPPQRTPEGPPSTSDNLAFRKYASQQTESSEIVRTSGAQVYALLQNRAAGGPEQLAGLITFAKLLDPGSVVREGEVALQREVGGIRAFIQAQADKLKQQGGLLGVGQRESIIQATQRVLEIVESEQKATLEELGGMAKAGGYNPRVAVPKARPFPVFGGFTGGDSAATPAGGAPAAVGPSQGSPALDSVMGTYGADTPAMDSFGRPVAPQGDPMFGGRR